MGTKTACLVLSWLVFGLSPLRAQMQPEWVNERPSSALWYYGIGMASTDIDEDFRDVARKNALKEIAQQIYVRLESSSNLSIDSYDRNTVYDYQENTSTETITLLEGFEFVDDFYNQSSGLYWVMLRLNKQDFEEKKDKLVRRLEKLSNQNLELAKSYFEDGKYESAFTSLITVSDLITTYSPLFPEGNFQMHILDMQLEIKNLLIRYLSDLQIFPVTERQAIYEGEDVYIPFMVTSRATGKPVDQIELIPEASGGVAKSFNMEKRDSIYYLRLEKVHGLQNSMRVILTPKLPPNLVVDARLLDKAYSLPATVDINRIKVFLSTSERNMNRRYEGGSVARRLSDELKDLNVFTTSDREDNILELYLTVRTEREGTDGFRYYAKMYIEITGKDKDGKEIFTVERDDLDSWGYNYEHAGRGLFLTMRRQYIESLAREIARHTMDYSRTISQR